GLTTVRQPLRQMGETAASLLLDQLSGRDVAFGPVTVEPTLVVRGSTASAAARV
ncbi:MAG: substrate-binding domain-containing protein, partial [Gammaproteobacteria bacterium]|nr:substrate-binding domain-containing protein [Gammaproteobacteria bacterium]